MSDKRERFYGPQRRRIKRPTVKHRLSLLQYHVLMRQSRSWVSAASSSGLAMYMCSYGILDFYVIARLERELAQYEYIESKRPPRVFWRSKAICIYLVTCRNLPSSECSRCCVMAENRCHRMALLIETCRKDVITPYRKPTPNTNLVAFSNLNSSESLISISYYCPPITASHQLHVNLPISSRRRPSSLPPPPPLPRSFSFSHFRLCPCVYISPSNVECD
jgi:hypothetical protein